MLEKSILIVSEYLQYLQLKIITFNLRNKLDESSRL